MNDELTGGPLPRDPRTWPADAYHEWQERIGIMLEAEPHARRDRVAEVEAVAEALVRQSWRTRSER